MAITQADAQTQLAAAIAALAAARSGEKKVRDRSIAPASIQELIAEVKYWDGICRELEAKGSRTGRRVRGATPS